MATIYGQGTSEASDTGSGGGKGREGLISNDWEQAKGLATNSGDLEGLEGLIYWQRRYNSYKSGEYAALCKQLGLNIGNFGYL